MTTRHPAPAWVDEYARVFHGAFSRCVPCRWGPIDLFALFPVLRGALLAHVAHPLERLKARGISPHQMAEAFCSPSGLRIAFFYLLNDHAYSDDKDAARAKMVIETCVAMLQACVLEDVFAERKNIIHTSTEVDVFMRATLWQTATPAVARSLGRFYNALQSLTLALYTDFFPQDCQDMHGPYPVLWSAQPSLVTIKHFSKLHCQDVWPDAVNIPCGDVKIFQIYQGIDISCEIIGGHTGYVGSPIDGLRAWAVVVDGRVVHDLLEIEAWERDLSARAVQQFERLHALSQSELVMKVLDLLCYQFSGLFALANLDWRPTVATKAAVAQLRPAAHFVLAVMPTLAEYVSDPAFEVYRLQRLYDSA